MTPVAFLLLVLIGWTEAGAPKWQPVEQFETLDQCRVVGGGGMFFADDYKCLPVIGVW